MHKILAFLFFLLISLFLPQSTHASKKFDGEYAGKVNFEAGKTVVKDASTKVTGSGFNFRTGIVQSEEQWGLTGKIELEITGHVDESGTVNGSVNGTGILSGNGPEIAKWDVNSVLTGSITNGEMKLNSQLIPVNVQCPINGVKCSGWDPFPLTANLTKTATTEDTAINNTVSDDYLTPIDKSEPLIEKTMGEVETSKESKRAPWYQALSSIFNNQGRVDIAGRPIEGRRVWEEGRSGSPLNVDDVIRTGNGRVVLKFPDGTKFVVMENTNLVKTADGFRVEKGGVYMDFRKIGNRVKIQTKWGNGYVTGTKLAVMESEDKTILELYEGSVEFERDGKMTKVDPGTAITVTSEGFAPVRTIDPQVMVKGWQSTAENIERESTMQEADIFSRPEMTAVAAFFLGTLFVLGIVLIIKHKPFGIILIIIPVALISYFFAVRKNIQSQEKSIPAQIPTSPLLPSAASLPPTAGPTLAATASAETANWKTYTDRQMGFSIKHPENVKPENYNDGTFVLSLWGPGQTADTEFFDGIDISINKKPLAGQTLAAVVEENRTGSAEIAGETISPATQVILGGITGLKYTTMNNDYYFLPLGNGYYLEILNLSADPENLGFVATAAKILETLRIIPAADTLNATTQTTSSETQEKLLLKIENTAACGYTDRAEFTLDKDYVITRFRTWYKWGEGEQEIPYKLIQNQQEIASGNLTRKDCDPYQTQWCIAADFEFNRQLASGNYVLQLTDKKICQNPGSQGKGFIYVWGK